MNQYNEFVNGVTSAPSKDFDTFIARLIELHEQGADIQRLMTASAGMSAEAGEFTEVVKKIVF